MIFVREDSRTFLFVSEDLKKLLRDGETLVEVVASSTQTYSDYSFVVFPFAKAYEGFLKELFFKLDLISEKEYFGHRFRIGRTLNPVLEKRFRSRDSIYDKLANYCGNKDLAEEFWEVWKKGRNLLFHYFPNNYQALTLDEAKKIIVEILAVMEKALAECRV